MLSLLRLLSWRHLRTHWVRTLLATTSIMLGVALFVSTEVAHTSTLRAFERAQSRLAGKATYRVSKGYGLGADADVLQKLEAIPGVLAAPVVQENVVLPDLPDEGRLVVLGVDFAREQKLRDFAVHKLSASNPVALLLDPTALIITESFAIRNGLRLESRIKISAPAGTRDVVVRGIFKDVGPAQVFGGSIAFMGMPGAQAILKRTGYDRIDVAPGGAAPETLRAAIGPNHRLESARASNKTLDDMLSNIRSLVILSVIGLLVGLFIVYLSVSIGVIERGKAIGTARALGASRTQILSVFLIEAFVLGVVGSLLGVTLGWLLASGYVQFIAATVNKLVLLVDVDRVVLPVPAALGGMIAGVVTAVMAAYFPARRASQIAPTQALRPATIGQGLVPNYARSMIAGAVIAAVGVALTTIQVQSPPWVGLLATAFMFLGVALTLPQITIWLSRRLRTPLRRWFRASGFLAADNVMRYPQRSALTVVALGGAMALMVTSASIIGSFRHATTHWLDRALPFDLSLQPAQLSDTVYSNAALPSDLPDRVRAVPGVDEVYALRARIQVWGENENVLVLGVDFAQFRNVLRAKGTDLEGGTKQDHEDLIAGRSVGISENFAALHGVEPGEMLTLRTPSGEKPFRISHAVEDYSWPRGVIVMDRSLYRRHWNDDALTYVDLTIAKDADPRAVRAEINRSISSLSQVFVYTADDIRGYAIQALEDSFVLANAQVAVAMLIGFLGIVNTLLISVLRRQREIGLIRVVGMRRNGIGRMVAMEAMIVALVGGGFGIVAGLVAAALPASNTCS